MLMCGVRRQAEHKTLFHPLAHRKLRRSWLGHREQKFPVVLSRTESRTTGAVHDEEGRSLATSSPKVDVADMESKPYLTAIQHSRLVSKTLKCPQMGSEGTRVLTVFFKYASSKNNGHFLAQI